MTAFNVSADILLAETSFALIILAQISKHLMVVALISLQRMDDAEMVSALTSVRMAVTAFNVSADIPLAETSFAVIVDAVRVPELRVPVVVALDVRLVITPPLAETEVAVSSAAFTML